MKGLPQDIEVFGSESGVLLARGIVEDHPLHSQSFMDLKAQKICHSPPEFISILLDNGFSFKEVEAGWLSHTGNSHGKSLPLNIP